MGSSKLNKYRQTEDALFGHYGINRVEHFIPISVLGIQVRVQIIGEGMPLIFIHGGPNAGSTWAELVSKLTGYQCILIDRPGCGLSEFPNGKRFSKVVLMDWILSTLDGILDHFQYEKVDLVGSSFGGYWALQYTLRRPDRIKHLILEGCPAMVEGMGVPGFMKALTRPVLKWIIPKLPTSYSYSLKIFKEIGHTYSVDHNRIDDIFVNWYVNLMNYTDTFKNDSRVINEMVTNGTMNPEYILTDNQIQKITVPTLWLWGEDDPFGGVELGKRIHAEMIKSEFIPFANSGHLPWLDEPELHAQKIRAFIG